LSGNSSLDFDDGMVGEKTAGRSVIWGVQLCTGGPYFPPADTQLWVWDQGKTGVIVTNFDPTPVLDPYNDGCYFDVNACSFPFLSVRLYPAPDVASITCPGSAEVKAIAGDIEVTFGSMTVSLPEGASLHVDEPAPGRFIVDVGADSSGPVMIGGVPIAPGVSAFAIDLDGDGLTAQPDPDDDGDDVPDATDNCTNVHNIDQADRDSDGIGDDCDGRFGDADCDDNITPLDALLVMRQVLGSETGAECILVANVHCADTLNMIDALDILRFAADLPSMIPAGCPGIGIKLSGPLS
jgi:hypothetical protein